MAVTDYAEKDADMLPGSVGNSQTGEHTFTRGWKAGSGADSRRAEIEAELRAITFVTDPLTNRGKTKHAGTYDCLVSGWSPDSGYFIQTLKKRIPYTLPEIAIAEDVFSVTTEQQSRNQETPALSTTWIGELAAGITRRISASADAFKKWVVSVQETTSKEVVIHIPIIQRGGGGTEHHIICRNQRGASPSYEVTASDDYVLPPLVEGDGMMYDFAGIPQKNDDDTWNWSLVYRQDNLVISAGESKTLLRVRMVKQAEIRDDGEYAGEKWWRRYYYYTIITYQAHATKAEAWAVSGQLSYSPDPPSFVAPGIWISKIEVESSLPTKEWDAPAGD